MSKPTDAECQAIANMRGLDLRGVRLAADRGILFIGGYHWRPEWYLKSPDGRNAQARRMDGRIYLPEGKAKTLRGSQSSWPIGIPVEHQTLALCEGGPDVLAACSCIAELGLESVGVVGMMGALSHIPREALPHFAGKRVRIFVHNDEAGNRAALRWASQLREAGAVVDGFAFDDIRRGASSGQGS